MYQRRPRILTRPRPRSYPESLRPLSDRSRGGAAAAAPDHNEEVMHGDVDGDWTCMLAIDERPVPHRLRIRSDEFGDGGLYLLRTDGAGVQYGRAVAMPGEGRRYVVEYDGDALTAEDRTRGNTRFLHVDDDTLLVASTDRRRAWLYGRGLGPAAPESRYEPLLRHLGFDTTLLRDLAPPVAAAMPAPLVAPPRRVPEHVTW